MLRTAFGRDVAAIAACCVWLLPETGSAQTWVNNRTGNSTFNFSVLDGATPRAIGMADPTVLVLNVEGVETYYVTGTTDDHHTANFAIYKSTDLDNWSFHKTAFDGGPGMNVPFPTSVADPPPEQLERPTYYPYAPSGGWLLRIGSRLFANMWSPHLWVNPNGLDPNVYLCFSAADTWNLNYSSIEQISIMVSQMPLEDFINGNGFFSEPVWYYYKVDNVEANDPMADGGVAAAAVGPYWAIPSTTALNSSLYQGWVTKLLGGMEHTARPDERTNLTDAPFVFFDLGDGADPDVDGGGVVSHRPWLLYTCAQYKERSGTGPFGLDAGDFHGGNSAAFPLYTANLFDAGASTVWSPIDLFHRFNNHNRPPCVTCPGQGCRDTQDVGFPHGLYLVPNGSVAAEPSDLCDPHWMYNPFVLPPPPAQPQQYYFGGYAEGPAAFYYQNRYYLFISRNMYWGPAYMMTYRVVEDSGSNTFENTGLSSPTDRTVAEDVLMASDWLQAWGGARNPTCKRSYGGGEVFMANGKPYVAFHALTQENSGNPFIRRIYFKELTFETTGKIKRLYEPQTTWSQFPPPPAAQDLGKFQIP